MRYRFIDSHRHRYSVRGLCQVLGVCEKSYYAWKKRSPSARDRENQALLSQIRLIFREHKGRYGSPRISCVLRARGIRCSENRVARLMKADGLRARMKKRYIRTTHSSHHLPLARDFVQRAFRASRPDQLWLSDITYIRTREGWLYLNAILDVYSRRIVGWSLSRTLDETLVHHSLDMAFFHRRPGPGTIFHTDRGSQYAATSVRLRLKNEGILQSMSRKGNCYDNAMMESFFSSFKRELGDGKTAFSTRREAYIAVKDYLENYYNRVRIHSGIENMSPVQFEKLNFPT
ncbi:MAG: IS3 family transposase [Calditrichaeota bacterium]|nr:MAG: IS3 family transposase [Calditrichota bacterium]